MSKLKVEVEEDGNLILDGEGTVLDIIKMAGALIEVAAREADVTVNELLQNFMEVDALDDDLAEETDTDLQ
jgi:hypothetical protein